MTNRKGWIILIVVVVMVCCCLLLGILVMSGLAANLFMKQPSSFFQSQPTPVVEQGANPTQTVLNQEGVNTPAPTVSTD